jgi:hypothetical protein
MGKYTSDAQLFSSAYIESIFHSREMNFTGFASPMLTRSSGSEIRV